MRDLEPLSEIRSQFMIDSPLTIAYNYCDSM